MTTAPHSVTTALSFITTVRAQLQTEPRDIFATTSMAKGPIKELKKTAEALTATQRGLRTSAKVLAQLSRKFEIVAANLGQPVPNELRRPIMIALLLEVEHNTRFLNMPPDQLAAFTAYNGKATGEGYVTPIEFGPRSKALEFALTKHPANPLAFLQAAAQTVRRLNAEIADPNSDLALFKGSPALVRATALTHPKTARRYLIQMFSTLENFDF